MNSEAWVSVKNNDQYADSSKLCGSYGNSFYCNNIGRTDSLGEYIITYESHTNIDR